MVISGIDTGLRLELERVGEVGVQQGVALGRRLALADLVLVEGVQEADAREPVAVAIEHAGAGAMRRDARNIAARRIIEGRPHEVVLPVDAPRAFPHAADIELRADLDAVELRVALLEHDLVELTADAAGGQGVIAFRAVSCLKMKPLNLV